MKKIYTLLFIVVLFGYGFIYPSLAQEVTTRIVEAVVVPNIVQTGH